jgi:hypothetical protein
MPTAPNPRWNYADQNWALKFLIDLFCILTFFLILKSLTHRPENWRDLWFYSAVYPIINLLVRWVRRRRP